MLISRRGRYSSTQECLLQKARTLVRTKSLFLISILLLKQKLIDRTVETSPFYYSRVNMAPRLVLFIPKQEEEDKATR